MNNDQDELVFCAEDGDTQAATTTPASDIRMECPHIDMPEWKVLIVDDEEEVHNVTKLVLGGFVYKNRKIKFMSAYSGEEAKNLLLDNPDTAIVLLDVVMEESDSGLRLVKFIREEMQNKFVRIILRTGQPGQAPEEKVIVEYDINDYKEKTELTSQKLITTIVSALRTFCDITVIECNRKGLEKIIDASGDIFELQSMEKFTSGVLTQLTSLLELNQNAMFCQSSGFAAVGDQGEFIIMAATGEFQKYIGRKVKEVVAQDVYAKFEAAAQEKKNFLYNANRHVGYFKSSAGSENIIYLEGCRDLSQLDKQLIEIFFANVSIAYDNLYLNREVEDTQREIIYTLGETIECRSKETGNHVRRVAEYVHLLARKYGLGEDEADTLRMASPLHDLGKLATPDSILNKPGRLTSDEFAVVKHHAHQGYDLLKASSREILKAAAIIAAEHHERFDGKGYPNGLTGEEIHLYGRLAAVADVFDALMSDRVYRQAWPVQDIVRYFQEEKGKHFDSSIVDLLLNNLDDFLKINAKYGD